MKTVKFEEYGGPEVLEVVDMPEPSPGRGEVIVRVVAAGINPGESAIRSGAMKEVYPADFPEGQGSDLAGVISSVGEGVEEVSVTRLSACPTPATPTRSTRCFPPPG
jgi:NADPH2:quinone reductase